jgi:hypothetical protein
MYNAHKLRPCPELTIQNCLANIYEQRIPEFQPQPMLESEAVFALSLCRLILLVETVRLGSQSVILAPRLAWS